MVDTKLIKLLSTFSKSEINRFSEFVSSPYYNKNIHVINLCNEILEFYPKFDSDDLTEEKIYVKVFGKEKFNYFKIKNIISDLFQLAVQFIKTIAHEKKGIENEIELLNEFHERKLDNFYKKKEKQINKEIDGIVRDEFYYDYQYKLAKANTSHYKFEKSGYTFNLIQNEFDIFLNYSLVGLLRHYAKMLTNKNHGNIDFKLDMFDDVWNYVKDKDFNESPSCKIYKQIITVELNRDENDFSVLLELKKKYAVNLSYEDLYYVLLVINSFAVHRLKMGDETYYKVRYETFKEMVERGYMLEDNILFVNFISVYTSACMVGQYDWAESFMEKFKPGIIPKTESLNAINYCRGFRAYREKQYAKALEYFSKTTFKLFITKVMVKSYTLRIFYEQNQHEQTLSAIDAFRHYLKSEEKISEEQKSAHYEFIRHLGELTRLKQDSVFKKDGGDLAILKKEIKKMSSNPLGAKNWLIDKAENFN